MKYLLYYFYVFITYSILGWVMESAFVSIHTKKFVNRGFLIGPCCPIYGYGSLAMIIYLEQYKDNLLTVFLLSVVICSIIEYITSYLMEVLFKTRWWDYSNKKFNLNGRICGQNALLFGLGGVAIIYITHPFLKEVYLNANETLLLVVAIIFFLIYLTDTIVSLNIVNRFKQTISAVDLRKDSTQEFKKMVTETIKESHKIFQKRLLFAFPNIDLRTKGTLRTYLKKKNKKEK